MAVYRRGVLVTRLWRSRRMIWRVTAILISLSVLSLLGMMWSLSLDYVEVAEVQKVPQSFQPPPPHDGNLIEENRGKTPFRWLSQETKASSSPPPTAKLMSSTATFWFNDAEGADGEGNVGLEKSFYQSHGVARVVLATSTDPNKGMDTPKSPQLLASNVSWRSYERYIQMHEKAPDKPADGGTLDTLRGSPQIRVRPLALVEVQLLRQRMSRNVWATSTQDMSAIVGIVPFESPVLATADELLVEHHLQAEDRLNPHPDPSRFLPLAASPTGDGRGERGSSTLSIDTSVKSLKAHAAYSAKSTTPTPLIELKSTHRPAGHLGPTEANTDVSPTATLLTWRAGDAEAESPVTVDIALDVVHPRHVTRATFKGGDDLEQQNSTSNEVYTDALQATVCSTHLVRLYGLSTLSLSQQRQSQRDAKTDVMDGINSIPLNMPDTVEVMVGGRPASSPHVSMAGVVPLLYMELDTSDAPQQSSLSSQKRRTVGLLWLHSAPFILSTFTAPSAQACVRLRSTAGSTKLYMLPGPTPADVLRQYYTLTGFPTLPPRFFLGYHHGLRGSAVSTEKAVEALDASFLRSRVPLDSVWLTDTAVSVLDTPFTWNMTRFPDPVRLQSNLWYSGRRYVVVRIVPTIPITTRSPLFLEGRRENFFVTMNAEEPAGWPTRSMAGVPSHVVDFTNPSARRWYGNMLKYRRYVGSTNHTFAHLQHAMPSVMSSSVRSWAFSECAGRELSRVGDLLPMEVGHYGSFAHREVHQLLPVDFARSVHAGMLRRTQYVRRALVLTENYYAGIQRYAVVLIETQLPCAGDFTTQVHPNGSTVDAAGAKKTVLASAWAQLQLAVRWCAQLSALGIPFSGANLGAGLTKEVLRELLQHPKVSPAAEKDAQEGIEVDSDDGEPLLPPQQSHHWTQVPDPRAVQSTISREVDQLLVRWYQAGVFFPLMYTEEDTEAEAVTQSVRSGMGDVAGPWWMRLPVEAATRAAMHANLNVRYALVPYLYTVAYNVSEKGGSFFAPLCFAQPSPARCAPTANSDLPTCYAVGEAIVVCPVTSSTSKDSVSPTLGMAGTGLFDLWTGVWDTPTAPNTLEDTAAAPAEGKTPLRWLTMTGRGAMSASGVSLPTPASLVPAFLRPGHIVATQNVLWPSEEATESSTLKDDMYTVRSTHMGANWTLTVALPPLPLRTASTPVSQLLADGDVFWDEGSRNSQMSAPVLQSETSQPPIASQPAHHCLLKLKCFYEVREGAAAKLVVEVRQTSSTCAEALAELQSHWQEQPEGFAERLSRAKELRDARLHAREVERNEEEDRGRRIKRNAGQPESKFNEEDLNGLRLPRWAEEAVRNDLWHSHLLHRIRFLFQRKEDALQLVDLHRASSTSTVVVERLAVASEAGNEKILSGNVLVSRDSLRSNEVLVNLSPRDTSIDGANAAAVNELAATPLFGVVAQADESGDAALHVPPTHTWRFVFSLK
ncbi:glycosyl hydrolase-like protein [Leptomonas seymouri]|uniref:Glycosyl hydrolase-like protein n=1 Tax=Leptomonas seymouri TaxID=5684 RepID=A0A0N1P9V1_LEPSE|nr:glycosyl hydrolase-like protein [Leptomonas seymouri]|eukprot:KPI84154.1 glycosyl hydrolase-like protein [Leptomonas seymouri]